MRGLADKLRFAEEQKLQQQRLEEERYAQERIKQQEQHRLQEQLRAQEALREKEEHRIQEQIRIHEDLRIQEQIRIQEELRLQENLRHQEQLRAQEQIWAQKQLRLQEELKVQEHLLAEEKRRAQEQLHIQEELRAKEQLRLQEQIKLQEQLRQQEELRLQDQLRRQEELRLQDQQRAQEQLHAQEQRIQEHNHSQTYVDSGEHHISKTFVFQSSEHHTITQNNINDNGNGNQTYSTHVGTSKQAPVFALPLSDATVQEGEQFTFKCHAIGNPIPTVEWFKDGLPVKTNPDYFTTYENGLATLTIDETFAEDSACFVCIATNSEGTAGTQGRLVVKELEQASILVPPNFIRLLENNTISLGASIELHCKVEGNPLPTVQWFKNGDCIDFSHQQGLTYNNGEAILRFDDIQLEDEAVYTCKANNMIGFDQTSGILRVITDNRFTTPRNGMIQLHCTISLLAYKFPAIFFNLFELLSNAFDTNYY